MMPNVQIGFRGLLNMMILFVWVGAQFNLVHGGLMLMSIFWIGVFIVLGSVVIEKRISIWLRLARLGTFLGMTMNASVVLLNGGYMPVLNKMSHATSGIWRRAVPTDHLLFFADRFAGFSIGDFCIIGFAILAITIAHYEKKRMGL